MYSILFAPAPGQIDELTTDLWEHGCAGFVEEPQTLRAYFEEDHDPAELVSKYEIVEMRQEPASDYGSFDREGWEPISIGGRFFIAPSWVTAPTPPGRLRLTLDNTGAFGTGRHESSQLMLCAMEEHVKPGMTVLDVGSGSGILSLAARELGAARVCGCDIDFDAVSHFSKEFAGMAFVGSADAVCSEFADLVLANISAKIVDAIATDLKRVTSRDGHVLIAGFVDEGTPERFTPERVWRQEGWQCWLCAHNSIHAPDRANDRALRPHPREWW